VRILALPRRIWKCLHPFTWLVMLVVGAGLVIIVVPGRHKEGFREENAYHDQATQMLNQLLPSPKGAISFSQVHGWPKPWAATRRDTYVKSPLNPYLHFTQPPLSSPWPGWTSADAWPYKAAASRVHWGNLLLDMVVAVAVLAAFGAATEFWLRRRGGPLRLRIIDLLAVTTVGALALGWYRYHERVHGNEQRLTTQIMGNDWIMPSEIVGFRFDPVETGSARLLMSEFRYCGPDWLILLIGNERLLPACRHRYAAKVQVTADWRNDIRELESWPYLQHVEFAAALPSQALATLEKLPRLDSLTIRTYQAGTHDYLLQRFDFQDAGGLVGPRDHSELARLHLQRLTLQNQELLAEDVDRIVLQLSSLKVLTLIDPSITIAELNQLRDDHPWLTLEARWPAPSPFPDDKEPTFDIEARIAKLKAQRDEEAARSKPPSDQT
jgi:hypothetical protein